MGTMALSLEHIADRVGGVVRGDPERPVTGVAPIATGGPGDLTFAADEARVKQFLATDVGAAIVPPGADVGDRDVIEHPSPYEAFAVAIGAFHPPVRPAPGVSPHAVIDPSVTIPESATIGALAVIEKDCDIGEGVVVGSHCAVGPGCRLGAGTTLHPHVVLYAGTILGEECVVHSGAIVGADGFGFTRVNGRHVKIPQVSHVEIGDDVEIGANACIDCGTLVPTRVGDNTKIDDLVMVGHNADVGRRVILCGMCGMGGSTVVEDDAIFQPQAGAIGHIRIGRGAILFPQAGAITDIDAGTHVMGTPAIPRKDLFRAQAMLPRLPELRAGLRRLRKQVADLEQGIEQIEQRTQVAQDGGPRAVPRSARRGSRRGSTR